MSLKKIREINAYWDKMLDGDILEDPDVLDENYWDYEPFTIDYWNQKYKIVLCNLETYGGVPDKKDRRLTLDIFGGWLADGVRTIKMSALWLHSLYYGLHEGGFGCDDILKTLYKQNDNLLEAVKNTTYMNLRKEPGWETKEDKKAIYRFLGENEFAYKDTEIPNKPNREYLLQFIEALEADVFLISGQTGQDIIKKLPGQNIKLQMNKMYKYGKTLFVSINHPRTTSYEYIIKKAKDIYFEIIKE